jgi:asparagine synthase (glutamine-hydrolysing)
MCGIAGILDPDEARSLSVVNRFNERQHHRGPDHAVATRAGSYAIANTRLAIQDPTAAGNQPFWSADRRYVSVFNGEIYNYRELIEKHRLHLPSSCDGAIIPELWCRYGPACLAWFRGMFALAIVDTANDTLSLARDPFGIKPLYYRLLGDGRMAFASEPRVLTSLVTPTEISAPAIADFLHLGAMAADASPFVSVEAVPPNAAMCFDAQGGVTRRPIIDGERPLLDGPAEHSLGDTFRESVRLHLRSDVPSALLLSSGVDSAAIAAAARSIGQDLHCLTVRASGSDDETTGAAEIARRYGHRHEIVAAALDGHDLDEFFKMMQRPSIDGFNTFVVCRAVQRRGLRVAVSGLGGDEALGGYRHFRLLPVLSALRAVDRLAPARGALRIGLRPLGSGSGKLQRLFDESGPRNAWALDHLQREVLSYDQVRNLTGVEPPSRVAAGRGGIGFADLVEADLDLYLQRVLLPDADAFSMASSVELRVPFVDRPVFGAAVQANAGRLRWRGKAALARSLGDADLLAQTRHKKRGFAVPMLEWIKSGPLSPLVAALRDPAQPVWQYVDPQLATEIMATASPSRWSMHWTFAALNSWLLSVASDPKVAR